MDEFVEISELHIVIDRSEEVLQGLENLVQYHVMQVWQAFHKWHFTPEITLELDGEIFNVIDELAKLLIKSETVFGKRPTVDFDGQENLSVNEQGQLVVRHSTPMRRKLEDRVSQMKAAAANDVTTTGAASGDCDPQP